MEVRCRHLAQMGSLVKDYDEDTDAGGAGGGEAVGILPWFRGRGGRRGLRRRPQIRCHSIIVLM